jgi:hypothetical protein
MVELRFSKNTSQLNITVKSKITIRPSLVLAALYYCLPVLEEGFAP